MRRTNFLIFFFVILFSLTIWRIFDLSINKNKYFLKLAENQKKYGAFESLRGEIFIKDIKNNKLVTLATNKLSANGNGYIRIYPEGELCASIVGFLGFKDKDKIGQYGIEGYYEPWLSGRVGSKNIFSKIFQLNNQIRGSSLILTIDKNIQFFLENKLKELISEWGADGASGIIQDPNSGAILAMASFPTFNPNNYSKYQLKDFINQNIQKSFEPGSSFKTITMATGLDTKSVTPETTYFDSGEVVFGNYTIRNFDLKSYGEQSMTQVLEKSINTGAIFVMRKIGQEKFLEYIEKFKFGQKLDIDLVGEVNGDIKNLYTKREINFATASFGQGIAVTPIQLINSYSAIANGGKLLRPFVVEKIIKPNGESVDIKPEIIDEVINPITARDLTSMLVSVVENGPIKKIKVPGYKIAAKTGTAQEPDPKGGYSNFLIHNLVGFGPVGDPKFTILIKLDRPKGVELAAVSLGDAFSDIVKFLINYFNLPPSESINENK